MRNAALLLLGWVVLPTPVAAQELRLEVRGGQVADERGASHPGVTLAPAALWSGGSAAAALSGEAVVQGDGGMRGAASLAARARSSAEGLALALALDGVAHGSTSGYRVFGVAASPRASYTGRGWRVEAGPQLGGWAHRSVEEREIGRGLWPWRSPASDPAYDTRTVRGFVAEARAGAGPVRWSGLWRSSSTEDVRWQDFEGEIALEAERVAVALEGGIRSGAVSERWAGARAVAELTPGLAVLVRGGRYAADPLGARVGGTQAEIGMRVRWSGTPRPSLGPAGLPRALPDGSRRIVLRAEPGARVELVADWTEWQPLAVPESGPGVYVVAARLPPGAHRFAFRVNGVWTTPEGYATEPDGYGGRHAVVRVAGR